eukprot:TRINITY_DN2097_c0_g1_i2.p1 TRINITY_DN2097_c0_g1~~TRINITY_DN2097_c0_g1_i2.p1  ORF type:complete len:678 (-),score=67.04 TRINITY_DN2097_c0_g1_i2:826-2772(-)
MAVVLHRKKTRSRGTSQQSEEPFSSDSSANPSQLAPISSNVFPFGVPISVEGDPWTHAAFSPLHDDDTWSSQRHHSHDSAFAQQEGPQEEEAAYRDALIHFRRLAAVNRSNDSAFPIDDDDEDIRSRHGQHRPPPSAFEPSSSTSSAPESNSFSYYREYFVEQKRLGGGAFGSVYLVSHVVASHVLGLYAVKKMPANDARRLSQSLSEVMALQSIPQHKNITRYYHAWIEPEARIADFGPSIPCLFLLQEYASAGSLEDLLLRPFDLDESDVWSLFVDAVSGVSHLHLHGVIHRDLKPSNLLLQPRPVAPPSSEPHRGAHQAYERLVLLVGDLGSVSRTRSGSFLTDPTQGMSLEYMAPEMLFDERGVVFANEKTDAWALGVCLYRMAYKSFPWDALVQPAHTAGVEQTQRCVRSFIEAVAANTFEFPSTPQRSSALKRCLAALLNPLPERRLSVSSLLQIDFIRSIKRARSSPLPAEQTPRHRSETLRLSVAPAAEPQMKANDHIPITATMLSVALFSVHFLLVSIYTPSTIANAFATLEISLHVFALVRPDNPTRIRSILLGLACVAFLASVPLVLASPLAFFARFGLLIRAIFPGRAKSWWAYFLGLSRRDTTVKTAQPRENDSTTPASVAVAKRPRSGSALMRM